jgi:hypothetical protein
MVQLPPPNVPRLHRCTHPVKHTLGVWGSVMIWLWWSIRLAPYVGIWLGNTLAPGSITLSVMIAICTNWLWILLIPIMACGIYVIGMTGCHRVQPQIHPLQPPRRGDSDPQPVLIERIYLARDEAGLRGLPGPVIVERIHYADPRNP